MSRQASAGRLVKVATARTPEQADQWLARLVAEGIPHTLSNRSALRTFALIPIVPFSMEILVPETDANRARSVLGMTETDAARQVALEARSVSWALVLLMMTPLALIMIAGLIITNWP